eukprot:1903451-Rhodomonas_salina.1
MAFPARASEKEKQGSILTVCLLSPISTRNVSRSLFCTKNGLQGFVPDLVLPELRFAVQNGQYRATAASFELGA